MRPVVRADSTAIAALGTGALVALTLIPVAPGQRFFPATDLGLPAVAGLGGLALLLAAVLAVSGERRHGPGRLEAATLWSGCGLALLSAVAAVVSSAQTMNLELIVLGQAHAGLHALRQPAAASVYIIALAVGGQSAVLRTMLGEPSRARRAAELALAIAAAALGATLFLAGFAGSGVPGPVWVGIKTVAILAVLLVMRRQLSGLGYGGRLAVAWAAAMVGLFNLAVTLALAPR